MFRGIPWQDVCKFLAGAFFVNAGILFYLYLARVSVPILGTGFIETPEVSGVRSIVHAVLFLIFFYLGFIRKWKSRNCNSKPCDVATSLRVDGVAEGCGQGEIKKADSMKSQITGLRVASIVFGLIALAQLVRLAIRPEVLVGGHLMPLWPSALAFVILGG